MVSGFQAKIALFSIVIWSKRGAQPKDRLF